MPAAGPYKGRSVLPMTGVKGFDVVMSNLNKAIAQIRGGTGAGLADAVAEIRRGTENSTPKTPVDLGNLRASWFQTVTRTKQVAMPVLQDEKNNTIVEGRFRGPKSAELAEGHQRTRAEAQQMVDTADEFSIFIMFGYSANYAMFVHEMLASPTGKRIKWKREGSGPKWFEESVKRNRNVILRKIRDRARIV